MEHKPLLLTLAANIRQLRTERGWSQEQFASKANLHRTYIGAIERAERNITLASLQQIADALGVDPVSLLVEFNRESNQ